MTPLAWAVLLLSIGLLLVVVEMFIPSGGALGFLSAGSVIAAIAMAFRHSTATGTVFMAVAVFGTPLLLALGFHLWPRTPLGRRILLDVPRGDDVLPEDDLRRLLKELVGKVGKAKTLMLPGGPVEIDGRTFDAVTQGQPVEQGAAVKVVEVRGTRIVVCPTEQRPPEPVQPNPNDPLSATIDQLGLDPFDDPLK